MTVANPAKRTGTVAVLDIGSTKVCCMIARPVPSAKAGKSNSNELEVIGIGHQRSAGVRAGAVVDLASAEKTIRRVVDTAEAQAGVAVGSLIVNAPARSLRSRTAEGVAPISTDGVTVADIDRAMRDAKSKAAARDTRMLHSLPVDYAIDGTDEIEDPTGMVGDELTISCHFVGTPSVPLRNLERVINRAHIEVDQVVATPYASALAATVADEAEMGCVVIDMGGEATSWAIMSGGSFLHGESVAVGGQHVTTDLARGLSIGIEQAERLKVLQANVSPVAILSEQVSVAPLVAEGSAAVASIPRVEVAQIVTARVEETFELVRDRIRRSGLGRHADRRVILTGGAAQLTGAADLARRMLARNVRVARPVGVRGLSTIHKTPAFATAVGLARFPQVADRERHVGSSFALPTTGRFARLGRWFRDF